MVSDLVRLGIVPRKSTKETTCIEIPPGLAHHYWRGLIDGDGGIYIRNTKNNLSGYVCLFGSYNIVYNFKLWVENFQPQTKDTKIIPKKIIFQ